MAKFPQLEWFRDFAARAEADEDFRKHCRWFAGTVAVRVDQTSTTIRFDRGMVLGVTEGIEQTDYLISGSTEQWDYLFEKRWALVRLYRSRTLLVRADPIRLMQNWKALFFIVECIKLTGKSS